MATGDTQDILYRLRGFLPARWWSTPAPIRDAVLGGIADSLAWGYSLVAYAKKQTRIATATGPILDVAAYDFLGLAVTPRKANETDFAFQLRTRADCVRERVSRPGVSRALEDLTGSVPTIQAPWNPDDTCTWNTPAYRENCNIPGWNVGFWDSTTYWIIQPDPSSKFSAASGYWDSGAVWGDFGLDNQVFITAFRPIGGGVPLIPGWDAGYWDASLVFVDQWMASALISDDEIYACVARNIAAGIVAWVQIVNSPTAISTEGGADLLDSSGRFIVF